MEPHACSSGRNREYQRRWGLRSKIEEPGVRRDCQESLIETVRLQRDTGVSVTLTEFGVRGA